MFSARTTLIGSSANFICAIESYGCVIGTMTETIVGDIPIIDSIMFYVNATIFRIRSGY